MAGSVAVGPDSCTSLTDFVFAGFMQKASELQGSPLLCANIVKKDPGRAGQKSLATAETNFTKPGAHNKGDLCIIGRLVKTCMET